MWRYVFYPHCTTVNREFDAWNIEKLGHADCGKGRKVLYKAGVNFERPEIPTFQCTLLAFRSLLVLKLFWITISKYVLFVFCSDKRPEQSIASARASVMVYDDVNKKWVPSGSSHGLSKVHIYHHFINNTFRVVGRKLQDHEVRTHLCYLPLSTAKNAFYVIFHTVFSSSCQKKGLPWSN